MSKKKNNALALRLEQLGLSVEKGAIYLRDKGVVISASYLGQLKRGKKIPSPNLAQILWRALGIKK